MLVLAAPFIVTAFLLDGLRADIVTFHGADEKVYHYPVIQRFIATFPQMQVWDYDLATAPLFHVVFATLGKLVSPALPFLRAVNASLSFASAVLLFFMLRLLRVDVVTSVLIALALILSPYVFGISFLLLTDSMALLFVVATLFAVIVYLQRGDWPCIALAALAASCAVLTRQSNIWLFALVLAAGVMRPQPDRGATALGTLVLLALAAAPLVVLFVAWGGPNPPKWRVQSAFNPGAVTFFTACIGAYGAPLALAAHWGALWPGRPTRAFSGEVDTGSPQTPCDQCKETPICWLGPDRCHTSPRRRRTWRSRSFRATATCGGCRGCFPPSQERASSSGSWCRSALLLLVRAWERDGARSLPFLIYVFAAATFVSNAAIYQKYFDYLALLISFLAVFGAGHYRPLPSRAVLALYCAGFIAYAAGNPFR